jgi:hypothetical protein
MAVAILCLMFSANRADAQAVKGSIVSVGIGGIGGKDGIYREGCWVPVQVQIKNMTPGPFVGRLGVTQLDLDGDRALSLGPEFVLQPGVEGRTLWAYYWPRTDISDNYGISEIAVYDRSGPVAKLTIPRVEGGERGFAYGILPDVEPAQKGDKRSTRFVVVLGDSFAGWRAFQGMWGGTEAVHTAMVKGDGIPDDAKGLDGVDLIVWEADVVKVSDVGEFQLKAIMDWVRSGGHLMISVGSQGQEFSKSPAALQAAMPIELTGKTRDVPQASITGRNGGTVVKGGQITWTFSADNKTVVQAIGDIKNGSRPVAGTFAGAFAEHPLAVTGLYGRGAVTVITFNVANPDFKPPENQAIAFWNQMAGWQGGPILTAAAYRQNDQDKNNKDPAIADRALNINTSSRALLIGKTVPEGIDVKDVTAVRILVALLFLAVYWLVAGPVGHLVMRQYRVVHWSWWIFGGVVLAATAVAGVVVLVLHVNAYDLRHRTFVVGTVNSPEVSVAGYYGVYAPVSGTVKISQPRSAWGINYLAPLCVPSTELKSFADPQGYTIDLDPGASDNKDASAVAPVFRNTLKKLQGRWTGEMGKLEGAAQFVSDSQDLRHIIKGTLTNNTGYDLENADIVVYLPRATPGLSGNTYLFHVNTTGKKWKAGEDYVWKQGETIALENLEIDEMENPLNPTLERGLSAAGYEQAADRSTSYIPHGLLDDEYRGDEAMGRLRNRKWRDDLLFTLLDLRAIDGLESGDRVEPVRGPGRYMDCTKLLKAACGLVVARAGNDTKGVKSPVPLKVDGKQVDGTGKILFAWALPISGAVPPARIISTQAGQPGLAPPAPAGRGRGLNVEEVP